MSIDTTQAIVRMCTHLIAAPRTLEEERRSGTWATIRYAKRCGRPVMILAPERGKEAREEENPFFDL